MKKSKIICLYAAIFLGAAILMQGCGNVQVKGFPLLLCHGTVTVLIGMFPFFAMID